MLDGALLIICICPGKGEAGNGLIIWFPLLSGGIIWKGPPIWGLGLKGPPVGSDGILER